MVSLADRRTDADRVLREHEHRVLATVRRLAGSSPDAEDLAQECRLAIWLAWQDGCPLNVFPSRRANGAVIDAMRRAGRYGFRDVTGGRAPKPASLSQPASPESEAPLSSVVAAPDRGESSVLAARREAMAEAFSVLTTDERLVLNHQVEDMLPLKAIGRLYGRPTSWASAAAARGYAKLEGAVVLMGGAV